jgi:uncharacterized protein YoxC
MNNEEKILQMLKEMHGDIRRIDGSIAKLETLPHQVQLAAEAVQHTNEKIDTLQRTVDDMAPTVTALDVLHQMRSHQ